MIPKDTHPSNLLSYLQQHHITSPHHFVLVLVLFILRFCLSVHNFHVLCIKYSTITQIAQFLSTSQNEKAPQKDKNTLQSCHVKIKCYQASISTKQYRYGNITRNFFGGKLFHLVKIILAVRHSKMCRLCYRQHSFVLIQTKGDGNYLALKGIDANCPEEQELVVKFIDPCLISIYQSTVKAVNVLLKKMIKQEHHNNFAKLLSILK